MMKVAPLFFRIFLPSVFGILLTSEAPAGRMIPINNCDKFCLEYVNQSGAEMQFNEDGIPQGWKVPDKPEKMQQSGCSVGQATGPDGRCYTAEKGSCGEGASWSGTAIGGMCVCNRGGTFPNCAKDPDEDKKAQQEDPKKQCRNETYAFAQQCDASHGSASSSCDGARLDAAQQRFQKQKSELQGKENTAGACSAAQQAQSQFSNELSQFASTCQSAVTQCTNACSQMIQKAQACDDPQATARAQQSAPNHNNCTTTLASRPSQARGQAQQNAGTAQDGDACAQNSNSSSQGKTAALDDNEKPDTSGKFPSGLQNPDAGGSAPLNPDRGLVSGPQSKDVLGTDSESEHSKFDVSGSVPHSGATGGYGSGMGLASLPQTPNPSANATDAKPGDIERTKSSDALSGTYGGGGGRGPLRMYAGKAGAGAGAAGFDENAAKLASSSGEENPNLDQFRPRMSGMTKCWPGTFPNPQHEGECLYGANKDIFGVMNEKFQKMREIPTNFINEGE